MAGTATWTKDDNSPHGEYGFTIWRCAWTANSSGEVSAGAGVNSQIITGILLAVNFISDGTDTPTTAYDVEMRTSSGQNVLYDSVASANTGANIASAVDSPAQQKTPLNAQGFFRTLYMESITPYITNAGDSKKGIIEMILK
jgi:hypothetical protein